MPIECACSARDPEDNNIVLHNITHYIYILCIHKMRAQLSKHFTIIACNVIAIYSVILLCLLLFSEDKYFIGGLKTGKNIFEPYIWKLLSSIDAL